MLTSFHHYQNKIIDSLFNHTTERDSKIHTNSEKEQYENMNFYPCSTKEWSTSAYFYNKSSSKSLISKDSLVNKLVKSFSNMLQTKMKFFNRRRDNKTRYSADQIYTSRAELAHTNSELHITQYIYNKIKSSLEHSMRNFITLVEVKTTVVGEEKVSIPNYINRLLHIVKSNFFMVKKWDIVFFIKKTNFLDYVATAKLKKKYFNFYNIPGYGNIFLNKLIRFQNTLYTTTQAIHFNTSKFTTLVLNWGKLGLISLLEKLYNKSLKFDLVELRAVHLNSDVFSSAVALKLRDRKNNVVSILRKAVLQMVNIPDLHTLITFDDTTEKPDKNNIVNTIKQQVVSGVRFEASGRLTKRLIAMRAVFKYRYAGSLKNIRSSFNRESSTLLRGFCKSNLQHSLINAKTRNGTFGLKTWMSSHSFWLSLDHIYMNLQLYISFCLLLLISVPFVTAGEFDNVKSPITNKYRKPSFSERISPVFEPLFLIFVALPLYYLNMTCLIDVIYKSTGLSVEGDQELFGTELNLFSDGDSVDFDAYILQVESDTSELAVPITDMVRKATFTYTGGHQYIGGEPSNIRTARLRGIFDLMLSNTYCPGGECHVFQSVWNEHFSEVTPSQGSSNVQHAVNPSQGSSNGNTQHYANSSQLDPYEGSSNGNVQHAVNPSQLNPYQGSSNGNTQHYANPSQAGPSQPGPSQVVTQPTCPQTLCSQPATVVSSCIHCTLVCCSSCY